MAVPKTPLMCAPSDADNVLGRAIMSADLVRGLKKINPNIWADETYTPGVWWPGKTTGQTCLWVGVPGSRKDSKKITGFVPGAIPEFTQISPEGTIITKGWRAIFSKVLKCNAAKRIAIENKFRVSLEVGPADVLCPLCRKAGRMSRSQFASGLCNAHENAKNAAWRAQQLKDEARYLARKFGWQPTRSQDTQSTESPKEAPSGLSL